MTSDSHLPSAPSADSAPLLLFVTGLSGAGLSSALNHLEDFGYEVLDNFPLSLIAPLMAQRESHDHPIALGIDTRTRGFESGRVLEAARAWKARIVFMTCEDVVLQKRFTETRRRHPMARQGSLNHGIALEKSLLAALRDSADLVCDTTTLSIHDLRQILSGHFAPRGAPALTLCLMSFGFRNGLPREADMVMDVRFLRNPHWIPELRPLTGQAPEIAAYVCEDPAYAPFFHNFKTLIAPLLDRYANEGKSYLTIAIGCTGGKHRSVFIVETLAKWLREQGRTLHVQHRDLTA